MSRHNEFHNLHDQADGFLRELAPGLTARIFVGEHAMLSIVDVAPNFEGKLHHHLEEQWGVLLEGMATRIQGDEEIAGEEGDFWRTLGSFPHSLRRS